MSKCSVQARVVASHNHWETGRCVSCCETHDWIFDDRQQTNLKTLCPIGQIEEAVDAGVAKILAALEAKG